MKKFYVFAAVAIAALASCTKSEVVYNQGQQEIGFRQFTGSMTKAGALSGFASSMGVFANINGTNAAYFSNANFVLQTGTTWHGDPAKYYPLQNALDFTLYAPKVEDSKVTFDVDAKTLNVTVDENTSTQTDYLYGSQRYLNNTKNAGALAVTLKHALSMVSVKIKSNVERLFTVTKVEIVNPIQNGSFVVTYGDPTSIEMTPGSTKGTVETYSNAKGTALTTSEEGISFGSKLVFPLAPLAATNAATNAAKLRITYNMEKATGLVAVVDLSDAWESGKHYTYNVTLTATEILLTPTVEDWGNGSTSPIEIK